jgi:hypothetical protein
MAANAILPDQRKELVHGDFQARNGRRDDPNNDQNQADKGQVLRSVRMMDKRHNCLPKADSYDLCIRDDAPMPQKTP